VANPNAEDTTESGASGSGLSLTKIFTDRDSTDMTEKCVLVYHYIGHDTEVTRLLRTGSAMIITPRGKSFKSGSVALLRKTIFADSKL